MMIADHDIYWQTTPIFEKKDKLKKKKKKPARIWAQLP